MEWKETVEGTEEKDLPLSALEAQSTGFQLVWSKLFPKKPPDRRDLGKPQKGSFFSGPATKRERGLATKIKRTFFWSSKKQYFFMRL